MMPIGVPKVPFAYPGGQGGDWVSIFNKMFRDRVLFLGRTIDDEAANELIAIMLYLDSDGVGDLSLYINSGGGYVNAGFAIFDTMRYLQSDVATVNVGLAGSMASLLLAGGEKGKRSSLPHARTMIHQPAAGGFQGQASDIKLAAEQILALKERIINQYAKLTGQDPEKIRGDLDRDNWMNSETAKEYGLIDSIVPSRTAREEVDPFDYSNPVNLQGGMR
jgi:ATP-dependent Clp protease protease subunit